ncbi:antirestriction protein ArdA [Acidipropionibacterium timonense]|uniref:antirestriction protein ArdA n=1 Tax=Acidipropionibacterium timonense TaxID=2161818 RepID=UPI00102F7B59|nr:antirestriction protein ArdA [Acidipropionibacterium timonense]
MSTTTNTPPSIWAGCLTCRNSLDELVGEWFDIREAASVDAVAVHQHRPGGLCCPDPELWVFDLDGVPVGREMDLGEAVAWGEVYTELEPHLWDALGAWVASGCYIAQGCGDVPVVSDFLDAYAGCWESWESFCGQLADDIDLLAGIPEHLQPYFDWSVWRRDLVFDYTVMPAADGGVFVFTNP